MTITHDTYESNLGNMVRVLRVMTGKVQSTVEIADLLNTYPGAVREHLEDLQRLGYVTNHGRDEENKPGRPYLWQLRLLS